MHFLMKFHILLRELPHITLKRAEPLPTVIAAAPPVMNRCLVRFDEHSVSSIFKFYFGAMIKMANSARLAPIRVFLSASLLHFLLSISLMASSDTKPVTEYYAWIQNCMSSALARESTTGQWGSSVDKMYNMALCNCRFARLSCKDFMTYEDFTKSYDSWRA